MGFPGLVSCMPSCFQNFPVVAAAPSLHPDRLTARDTRDTVETYDTKSYDKKSRPSISVVSYTSSRFCSRPRWNCTLYFGVFPLPETLVKDLVKNLRNFQTLAPKSNISYHTSTR